VLHPSEHLQIMMGARIKPPHHHCPHGRQLSPGGSERAARCDQQQSVSDGEQPFGAQCRFPRPERIRDSRLSGLGAGPAPFGEHDQPCTGIARVLASRHVAIGYEFVHELRGGLPGHAKVLSQLGDGGAAGRKPGEREPVRWAHVIETAGPDPGRDSVDKGAARCQQAESQRLSVIVPHRPSLTD
jgi:hypothetical protein